MFGNPPSLGPRIYKGLARTSLPLGPPPGRSLSARQGPLPLCALMARAESRRHVFAPPFRIPVYTCNLFFKKVSEVCPNGTTRSRRAISFTDHSHGHGLLPADISKMHVAWVVHFSFTEWLGCGAWVVAGSRVLHWGRLRRTEMTHTSLASHLNMIKSTVRELWGQCSARRERPSAALRRPPSVQRGGVSRGERPVTTTPCSPCWAGIAGGDGGYAARAGAAERVDRGGD
eukprot:COSAG03_NODE_5028_length_1360_cov_1.560666_2_plen_230_part_00